jgi:hypothetical protein
MLDQVIKQHSDAPYFHIGFDEVYYKLEHPKCQETGNKNFTTTYLRLIEIIDKYIINIKVANVLI